jgi:hypothetical protein
VSNRPDHRDHVDPTQPELAPLGYGGDSVAEAQHRRKSYRRTLLSVLASIALLALIILSLYRQRVESQRQVQVQIHQLACAVVALVPPQEFPPIAAMRAMYHCPPYVAPR